MGLNSRSLLVLVFLNFFGASASAGESTAASYYAAMDFSQNLKSSLFKVLDSYHLPSKNEDLILPKCSQGGCFKHSPISYNQAREYVFGYLHLEGDSKNTYQVQTYYCQIVLDNNSAYNSLGPMDIPNNNIANVEHAWPQSHFTGKFPKNYQKADLHILFPEISQINSIRGNFPFGEVITPKQSPCQTAALGRSASGEMVFEPDDRVKGDMARATFYFSTRYQVQIDANQEAYLRKWHANDPVDDKERERNDKIFEIQKIRNPFIDHPEFVSEIQDF